MRIGGSFVSLLSEAVCILDMNYEQHGYKDGQIITEKKNKCGSLKSICFDSISAGDLK